jgi:hypothetical protein
METSAKTSEGTFQAFSTILTETVKFQIRQATRKRDEAKRHDTENYQRVSIVNDHGSRL